MATATMSSSEEICTQLQTSVIAMQQQMQQLQQQINSLVPPLPPPPPAPSSHLVPTEIATVPTRKRPAEVALEDIMGPGEVEERATVPPSSTTNSSICIAAPPGHHVPHKIKNKIWQGEFIDFNELLPSATSSAAVPTHITVAGEGQITIQPPNPSRKQLTFLQWNQAWTTYMYIMGQKEGNHQLLHKMLVHADAVHRLYAAGRNWSAYDQNFRQLVANGMADAKWGAVHMERYLDAKAEWQVDRAVGMKPASRGRGTLRGQSFRSNNQNVPRSFCFAYHNGRGCLAGSNCRYSHACPRCNGMHPMANCGSQHTPTPGRGNGRTPNTSSKPGNTSKTTGS